jgi:hypothetical protein
MVVTFRGEQDPTPVAVAMSADMSALQVSQMEKNRDKIFATNKDGTSAKASVKKRGKDSTLSVRGRLTEDVTDTILAMKDDLSSVTIESSLNWLRGYSNAGVRKAAAELLVAKFDAFANEDQVDVEVNADYYSESEDSDEEEDKQVAPTATDEPSDA